MTPGLYFLLMLVGLPLAILLIALIGALLNREGNERLLDWKPTQSPRQQAELTTGDVQQMLGAVNRYRRLRGAPERSLEEIALGGPADPPR